ncbi:MAG TPA: hypothetical protein VKH62_07180 [Candidatus Binatia bacterium]|nr:hypothetical protein [Candidatus Binatia bacterium]
MRGIGTGAAIVTIDMTTDITTAKIGATVATVIADAMSEKQSVTTITLQNRAQYRGAAFVRRDSETRLWLYVLAGIGHSRVHCSAFAVLRYLASV